MAKRPSLAAAKVKPTTAAALRALAEPAAEAPPSPAAPTAKAFHAATREGLKKVTVGLLPGQHENLKVMAARRRATVEELLREAIADLFIKHPDSL